MGAVARAGIKANGGIGHGRILGLSFALVVALVLPAGSARATVLYDQTADGAGLAVPSQESVDEPAMTTQAADDFVVQPSEHWLIEEVEVLGSAALSPPRTFTVFIYGGGRNPFGPGEQLFAQRGIVPRGPNLTLPIQGAPLLDQGSYWISVQAVGLAPEPWSWETTSHAHNQESAIWRDSASGPQGRCAFWSSREWCLPESGGRPDQAFKLSGTLEQVLKTGARVYPSGATSSPPGISCPPTCEAAFPRGTVVTLTAFPLLSEYEFTGWEGGPGCFKSQPLPCSVTLDQDLFVWSLAWPAKRFGRGKLKRDPRTGAATLPLWLPATGVLSLASSDVEAKRYSQAAAGKFSLPLVPRPWTRRNLARTGMAKAKLWITFRPNGGRSETAVEVVTLRRREAR